MIALIVLISSSYALGAIVLGLLNLRRLPLMYSLFYSMGIGLGLWSMVLFLLGHAGLFIRPLLIGITVAAALPGPFILYREWRLHVSTREKIPTASLPSLAMLGASGIIVSLVFFSSFAPVTGGITNDEICTHLSIPAEWLSLEKIAVLPYAVSYQAGNAHLLFLLTSCFNPESGPRLVSWLCFVLCLCAVYCLSRNVLSRNGASFAVLITAVNPLVFRAGNIAFVDLESALFALLPLCALFSHQREKRPAWLVLCGLFAGIGCGIKPTNIIYTAATLVVAAALSLLSKNTLQQTIKNLLLLGAVASICASPWPVRNLVLTGSPTFPPPLALYKSGEPRPLNGDKTPYSYREIREYYDYCLSRYGEYRRDAVSFAKFPWDITMRPEQFQIGDSVGTLLLSFFPLVFFFLPLPIFAWLLILFAFISGLLLYFGVLPEARYYITVMMALAPLAAYAVTRLAKIRLLRPVVVAVASINLLFSFGVAIRITARPLHAVFSPEYRRQFRQEGIPYYEAFEYLRTHKIDTVLVKSPERIFYYMHGVYRVDTCLDRADSSYTGRVALDIDYSQMTGRNPALQQGPFAAGPALPENARLLFERADARIYTFTAPDREKKIDMGEPMKQAAPWRKEAARVHVVLPAYNEEKDLPELLERIDQAMADEGISYEVIVVDDGSGDRTAAIAEEHSKFMPIVVHRHPVNQGLGGTIREGLRIAAGRCGDQDIVIAMDADNTHTPGLIRSMTRLVKEGNDVVIASRYQRGAYIRGLVWYRVVLSFCARLLFQTVFPIHGVRDYTSGFRAYRGTVLKEAFSRYGDQFVSEGGFQCMVDILLKLRAMDVIICEVPLILRYDLKAGKSKMNVARTVWKTLWLMARRRLRM